MSNPTDEFISRHSAAGQTIDDVREGAARVADETSKYMRGERGRLRMPPGPNPEGTDAEFGVAAEVAMIVANAIRATGVRFRADMPWATAAKLLRAGWQRGHKLVAQELAKA